jgi:hypothetical protein
MLRRAYEQTIAVISVGSADDVLKRQYLAVQQGHLVFRDLRDLMQD